MQVMQAATEAAHVATCTASMAACTSMQAQLELDVEKKQLRHSKPRMVDSDCDLSTRYLVGARKPSQTGSRGSAQHGGGHQAADQTVCLSALRCKYSHVFWSPVHTLTVSDKRSREPSRWGKKMCAHLADWVSWRLGCNFEPQGV